MRLLHSARWMFLALLLSLVPASAFAGVFISVGFAPPALPVYEQPPCPEPGLMWTPGYWAYGPDGYYWVPGAWVPAPYEGALWTPGYWGWSDNLYLWHGGYWGRHVGYYGGVNYGFGYMGVGFAGGLWRGHDFVYNTAVVRVDNVHVRNVYVDRTIVQRNTIVNDRHVAFSGGPGGINHAPREDERAAMHEQHMAPTSFQTQHMNSAMNDHNSYARTNGGRPQNLAVARPLPAENRPNNFHQNQPSTFNNNRGGTPNNGAQARPEFQNRQATQPQSRPQFQERGNAQPQVQPRGNAQPQYQQRSNPQPQYQERGGQQSRNESRPAPQQQRQQEPRPQPQSRPQHESREPRR